MEVNSSLGTLVGMGRDRLQQLLGAICATRVAVIGDFCLDAYWTLDPTGSEASIETGKRTQAVRRQRYELGGAGNVVNNLVALGVGHIAALAVVGDDLFGREMTTRLTALGVDHSGVCTQAENWDTPVYGKPFAGDEELPRLDFGVFNEISADTEQRLLDQLAAALVQAQVVIVNQQLARGIHSPALIAGLNRLIAAHPQRLFVVDSRNRSEQYTRAMLKVNAVEAARLAGASRNIGDIVPTDELRAYAHALHGHTGQPVFITRGERGLLAYDGEHYADVPGIQTLTPVDPVGAGDTAVAAIAAALAAGASVAEAAELANAAATVTVRKLKQCGTATPAEILAVGGDADYVYHPELADDPRRARYRPGTEIEVVREHLALGHFAHALFDHDGTLSTLRQGWEAIMEPMMVRAILGPRYADADETLYARVVAAVRDYIDKSTGIQTLEQMEMLVHLVRRFGCVPPDQMRDRFGYKAIYNATLLEMVRGRLEKLRVGELDASDCTIKGAAAFLRALHARGVRLYLASGTDHADAIAEAKALGYAELFEGRIYGAAGDLGHDVKRMVVDRILRKNGLHGPELICFGDGPVELRETRKRGGLAVGVASDEVRRWGGNAHKRARLIRAGADLIVPDFSGGPALLTYLFGR